MTPKETLRSPAPARSCANRPARRRNGSGTSQPSGTRVTRLFRLRTQAADRKTRARGTDGDPAIRRASPSSRADRAHFVFIEIGQRLDDAAGFHQLLDAGNAVVMGLDGGRFRGAAGFDRVGINGALAQNPVAVEQAARFDDALLNPHELLADDVALLVRARAPVPAAPRNSSSQRARSRPRPRPVARTCARRTRFRLRASGRYRRRRRGRAPAPSARRHSVKATVESTPPLTKKKTFRSPTRCRICSSTRAMRWPGFQSFSQPQMPKTKFSRMRVPSRGVDHFRVELHSVEPARGDLRSPPFRRCRWSRGPETRRRRDQPHRDATSRSAGDRATPSRICGFVVASRSSSARPNSPLSPLRTLPPSNCAISCWP